MPGATLSPCPSMRSPAVRTRPSPRWPLLALCLLLALCPCPCPCVPRPLPAAHHTRPPAAPGHWRGENQSTHGPVCECGSLQPCPPPPSAPLCALRPLCWVLLLIQTPMLTRMRTRTHTGGLGDAPGVDWCKKNPASRLIADVPGIFTTQGCTHCVQGQLFTLHISPQTTTTTTTRHHQLHTHVPCDTWHRHPHTLKT